MIHLPENTRIYFASRPCDFRKSFNGLCGIIINEFGLDPLCNALFVFYNKRKDSIKILKWDKDGFLLFYKKLQKGTFRTLKSNQQYVSIKDYELRMILQGLDYKQVIQRNRFRLTE